MSVPNDRAVTPCVVPACLCLIACLACQRGPAAQHVLVSAMDYAYRVPDTLSAGATVFHLRNDGKVPHEMVLAELRSGVTTDSAYAVEMREGNVDSLYEKDAGLLTADPGEAPELGLRADLVAGRTYVLLCTFSDSASKPIHLKLGMYKPFGVR